MPPKNPMTPFRILIADDHQVICEGIKKIIESAPDLSYVGKANNEDELREILKTTPTDLVLLDVRMDYSTSIHEVIELIQRKAIKVAIYSSYFNPALLEKLVLKEELDGYIVKEGSSQHFVTALREIAKGKKYYSQTILPTIIELLNSKKRLEKLTKREREVLKLLLLNQEEIAKKLNITPLTVKRHLYKIKKKLGIKNNDEMYQLALQWHFIQV